MKVLFGVQCTGNGHISRSIRLIKELQKHVHVDVLTSGNHAELALPFDVKFRKKGLAYFFGTKGSFDLFKTAKGNNLVDFLREVRELPVQDYDMVISDFEPITSWAAYHRNVYSVAVSNQITLTYSDVLKPNISSPFSKFIIKAFSPNQRKYGLHYHKTNKHLYFPPIKDELRDKAVSDEGFYAVYLPFYGDKAVVTALKRFPNVVWKVFSKHCTSAYKTQNISIEPINNESFNTALLNCTGVVCGAGFGTTSEALYLGKKLLILPMRNQYEQECNAFTLGNLGVPIIRSLDASIDGVIENFLNSAKTQTLEIKDETRKIIETILTDYIVYQQLNGQYASA